MNEVASKPQSYFRGYWSIMEVVERMRPLADWMERFKPGQKELTLIRKDWDLIARWPKAASLFDIAVDEKGLHWRGFQLKPDGKPGRYEKSDD